MSSDDTKPTDGNNDLFESALGLDDEDDNPEEEASQEEEESTETSPEDTADPSTPTEEEASSEDEEEDEGSEVTYTVQKGFSVEGRTFKKGDVIPVKCKYCALWKAEWLGRVRCTPTKVMKDTGRAMSSNRFSCQSFFICMEMKPELDAFLRMSLPEVQTVRKMLPGIKKLLVVDEWLSGWIEKHDYKENSAEVLASAKNFVTAFSSSEQLSYMDQYIRFYSTALARREKEKRPRKPKFEAGDWVDWTDLETGQSFSGIILSMGRGIINLAGVNAQIGRKFTFKLAEWKKTRKPKITRKIAAAE